MSDPSLIDFLDAQSAIQDRVPASVNGSGIALCASRKSEEKMNKATQGEGP